MRRRASDKSQMRRRAFRRQLNTPDRVSDEPTAQQLTRYNVGLHAILDHAISRYGLGRDPGVQRLQSVAPYAGHVGNGLWEGACTPFLYMAPPLYECRSYCYAI